MNAALPLVLLALTSATDEPTSSFRIATRRLNDRVAVKTERGRALFVLHSPTGISRATVERTGATWPDSVILHLHLRGLESLQLSNGKDTLRAAVSSQDGRVRVWKDDKEDAPLTGKHPLWLSIRRLGKDGKPTTAIPLKEGYFEVVLPRAFLADHPQIFTVDWIDFYRN